MSLINSNGLPLGLEQQTVDLDLQFFWRKQNVFFSLRVNSPDFSEEGQGHCFKVSSIYERNARQVKISDVYRGKLYRDLFSCFKIETADKERVIDHVIKNIEVVLRHKYDGAALDFNVQKEVESGSD